MTTAGYSGTPLPRKLGIGSGARILLARRPAGFDLGSLPPDVTVHSRRTAPVYELILGFCPDSRTLAREWPRWHESTTPAGAVCIRWPKRTSGMPTDLTDAVVRDYGLAHGRVDVKVCAVDERWSGLKFVVRLRDRPRN